MCSSNFCIFFFVCSWLFAFSFCFLIFDIFVVSERIFTFFFLIWKFTKLFFVFENRSGAGEAVRSGGSQKRKDNLWISKSKNKTKTQKVRNTQRKKCKNSRNTQKKNAKILRTHPKNRSSFFCNAKSKRTYLFHEQVPLPKFAKNKTSNLRLMPLSF